MTKKLSDMHSATNRAILSHPIWGTYVAFSLVFTAFYMSNTIASSLFNIGHNDIVKTLMMSVILTIVLIVAARKHRKNGRD
jgi:hypothetical protein